MKSAKSRINEITYKKIHKREKWNKFSVTARFFKSFSQSFNSSKTELQSHIETWHDRQVFCLPVEYKVIQFPVNNDLNILNNRNSEITNRCKKFVIFMIVL